MYDFQIRKAYLVIEEKFDMINKYIGKTEVWRVSDEVRKNMITFMALEFIRITALLLQSFVPSLAENIFTALKIDENDRKITNVIFRKIDKNNIKDNFHHKNIANGFIKVQLEDNKKFFRRKIIKK